MELPLTSQRNIQNFPGRRKKAPILEKLRTRDASGDRVGLAGVLERLLRARKPSIAGERAYFLCSTAQSQPPVVAT